MQLSISNVEHERRRLEAMANDIDLQIAALARRRQELRTELRSLPPDAGGEQLAAGTHPVDPADIATRAGLIRERRRRTRHWRWRRLNRPIVWVLLAAILVAGAWVVDIILASIGKL
jgi:hypothetical protein